MAKDTKKKKARNFDKEYDKVMKGFKNTPLQGNLQQWTTPGDFFVKFSMYKESSSGAATSNTTFVSQ